VRQRILYADEFWRKQRIWAIFLIGFGAVIDFTTLRTSVRLDLLTQVILLAYIPAGVLFLTLLQYYRLRSYIQAREDGLKVSNLLSSIVIPYEEIRLIRVQPLRTAFQDSRKRQVVPMIRGLLDQPALFIRLRSDEMAAYARRKLGSRLAYEDFVVLPVPDPDRAALDLNGRLPEKQAVNLGGGRRKKRRR
jgi:hypothetical protein